MSREETLRYIIDSGFCTEINCRECGIKNKCNELEDSKTVYQLAKDLLLQDKIENFLEDE
jgi:hypothetical protein